MNGKIAGAVVGAILVAAVFGIAQLWRKSTGQKRSNGQVTQKNK